MVRIRLTRVGRPKGAFYRIVVIDSRKRREARPIEVLGHYDPKKDKEKVKINYERYSYWLKVGAQPSETVSSLVKNAKQPTS